MSGFWSWTRQAGRQSNGKAGRRQRRLLGGAEPLEGRRMTAVDVYLDDGYRDGDDGLNFIADWAGINDSYHPELIGLRIVGTEGNDKVEIFESGGVVKIKVTEADGGQWWTKAHSIEVPTIFFHGKGGDDILISNAIARTFAWGDAGDDYLQGGNGEMHLFGGDDDDTLTAGPFAYGNFFGEDGNDTMYGTEGVNQMWGGDGFDFMVGGGGDDILNGGAHDDVIYGGYGDDTIFGAGGDDDLYGQWGDDSIDGDVGDDYVDGGKGIDFLYGGDNTDHMYGGPDEDYDYIVGQRGGDVFHINFSGLADGGVNLDQIDDYRASDGDTFNYDDALNIVLEMVSRTQPNKQPIADTMSADEVPSWLYDEVTWETVTWERPPLEALNGEEFYAIQLVGDSFSHADPLTDSSVAEELPPTDWSEAGAEDVSDPSLENYDELYVAFGDEQPADDGVFDEPIDEWTVDNYFGDLAGSNWSSGGINTNTIRRTSGWFV
jgi:hypothetical protein